MKIQDIFKLNLNDRGGVKLFNKIMGRYNIPKADSKELINEVQNSSSGDGGLSTDSFLYIKSTYDAYSNVGIPIFYPFYRGLYRKPLSIGTSGTTPDPVYFSIKEKSDGLGMYAVEVFKVKDLPGMLYVSDGPIIPIQVDTTSYNSFLESLINAYLSVIPSVPLPPELSVEELIEMLKSQTVEITKEEFEELWNTYNV